MILLNFMQFIKNSKNTKLNLKKIKLTLNLKTNFQDMDNSIKMRNQNLIHPKNLMKKQSN